MSQIEKNLCRSSRVFGVVSGIRALAGGSTIFRLDFNRPHDQPYAAHSPSSGVKHVRTALGGGNILGRVQGDRGKPTLPCPLISVAQKLLWQVVRLGLIAISNFGNVLCVKGINEAGVWTSVVQAVYSVFFDISCPLSATCGVGLHHSTVILLGVMVRLIHVGNHLRRAPHV